MSRSSSSREFEGRDSRRRRVQMQDMYGGGDHGFSPPDRMNANHYSYVQDNYGHPQFPPHMNNFQQFPLHNFQQFPLHMNTFPQMQSYGHIPSMGYMQFGGEPGNSSRGGYDRRYGDERQDSSYRHRDRDRNERGQRRRSRSRDRGDSSSSSSRATTGRQAQSTTPVPVEIAFRVDTRSERISVQDARSFQYNQLPTYTRNNFYQDNMLGASEEYISKLPPNRRCRPKIGVDEFGNVVDAATEEPIESPNQTFAATSELSSETTPKARLNPSATTKSIQFISLSASSSPGPSAAVSNRIEYSLNKRASAGSSGVVERTEYYNTQLRKEPKNIGLWREFVQFQDRVFEEAVFEEEGSDSNTNGQSEPSRKRRRRRSKGKLKALIEKKVAVLDRALAINPKSIELCADKLDLLYQIYKPTFVLLEWRKYTNANQEIAAFWFEYLRFASTQLQLFNSTITGQTYGKTFDKFRSMLTPNFPAHQRPPKSHLVLADLLFSLCIILRSAGFTEKSVAIQQAQLEIDFHGPAAHWKVWMPDFEAFWAKNSLRFGEPGAVGWKNSTADSTLVQRQLHSNNFIPDSQVSGFEEEFFASISDFELGSNHQQPDSVTWLYIESLRSKMYWVPWRPNKGATEECDDSQRLVLSADVTPYIANVHRKLFSDWERQSMCFRHVIHLLLTLREDYLPRSHTLDSILSPIGDLGLSHSRTLLSQIFYCKGMLGLYTGSTIGSNHNAIQVPEGFRLNEFSLPSQAIELESALPPLLQKYSASVQTAKENLLLQSEANHSGFVRSVVEQSLDHLDTKLSATLVQTFFRFQQRNTYSSTETHKTRMRSAKNLMKHDKVRNSVGAYTELALLELFGGTKEKAVDLLVKAINSSGKTLRESETEEILAKDLDLMAELTRSYRLLAELHLRESPEIALAVLIALGNKFSAFEPNPTQGLGKPNTNALLKAKQLFAFVMDWMVGDSSRTDSTVESRLGADKCMDHLLQDTNLLVEWTTAFALFSYLTAGDLSSASELYSRVLASLPPKEPLSRSSRYSEAVVFVHHVREQLFINWSKLSALVLSTSPMENSKFRTTLCSALQEFPSSPPLLLLFTDVESQCSIAGKLWRAMLSIVKQDSGQNSVSLHWTPLFMALALAQQIEKLEEDEKIGLDRFGLGGPAVPPDTIFYKLDAILSAAESNPTTRAVPLIWRVHLKHLVLRANQGKDTARATSLFYDALRHCPSSKALYLDGVAYFPALTSEIQALLTEKGILVRLPKEELDLLLDIDDQLGKEVEELKRKSTEEVEELKRRRSTEEEVIQQENSSSQNVEEVLLLSDGEIDDCTIVE